MSWIKVLAESELKPGERRVVDAGSRRVLLVHHLGQVFALASACPHMGLPLRWGKLNDDCSLTCPWHHSAFDLRTGDVKDWSPWPPGLGVVLGALSRRKALPVFPVKVESGAIWVDANV